MFAIKIIGRADNQPCMYTGKFVRQYIPNLFGMRGLIVTTDKREDALEFETQAEALAAWQATSESMPLRPDGQPNRPLTAFHCMVVP